MMRLRMKMKNVCHVQSINVNGFCSKIIEMCSTDVLTRVQNLFFLRDDVNAKICNVWKPVLIWHIYLCI